MQPSWQRGSHTSGKGLPAAQPVPGLHTSVLYSSVPPINSREFLEGFIHHHLGLVLGAWCQPISCAGLGGSLGGEVCPEGSPGEVRLEDETLASWQGKVELRKLFFCLESTDSRWIPRKGGHCRQHSRGNGQ